ncbi:hypothetical protein EGX54_25510 [Vibrio parahaemolyticus]|nr:hypothetical protein [Vibrio parahaemolyticus]EGR1475896.1 hypothetical protein [Vibrio parahaemolyticus]EGR1634918.1 hypothetical protein [Vibrio parahaemolyticus]EGR1640039.1 hypothetical protein [Vibrio parahaemolyticus]
MKHTISTTTLNTNGLKADLQEGKIQEYELSMWVSQKWKTQDDAMLDLLQTISWDRGIRCELALVAQWSTLFIQAWVKDQTLKQTLTSYEYPDGVPNLTKNQTDEWTVTGNKLKHNSYGDVVELPWDAVENGEEFLFSTRYVLLPNQTILKFD